LDCVSFSHYSLLASVVFFLVVERSDSELRRFYLACPQVEQVEHVFEAHTIQRMELLVLSTLEWRMCVVTPFSYIDYFFHKLGISSLLVRALLCRVSEIVLRAITGESSPLFPCPVFHRILGFHPPS